MKRILRNFVTLFVCAADFDAKLRKIRRVALPVDDGDVANKRYVRANFERSTE